MPHWRKLRAAQKTVQRLRKIRGAIAATDEHDNVVMPLIGLIWQDFG